MLGFVAGALAGYVVGTAWSRGHVEHENGTTDLLPPVDAWPLLWWLLIGSWLLALALVRVSRPLRWVALGWLLGLPAIPVIGWLYAWHTFGTWGEVPLP